MASPFSIDWTVVDIPDDYDPPTEQPEWVEDDEEDSDDQPWNDEPTPDEYEHECV